MTAYRITYRTIDGRGRPTRASGLVVLPDTLPEALPDAGQPRLRLVLHAHGTTTIKKEVPSRFRDAFETGPALTFAAAGFAAAAPDYLGLGEGPGQQSWFDVPTETTAEVDMIRATRVLATEQGRTLRRGVDVTGFSQGASAALGLARELERRPHGGSTLHALAPVSGAYAFRDVTLPAVLDGRVEPHAAVVYVSLLLVSWNRIHHLYTDPGELFQQPYADRVTRLMNGRTPAGQMLRGLPSSVDALLTPAGIRLLEAPHRCVRPSPRGGRRRLRLAPAGAHPSLLRRGRRAGGARQHPGLPHGVRGARRGRPGAQSRPGRRAGLAAPRQQRRGLARRGPLVPPVGLSDRVGTRVLDCPHTHPLHDGGTMADEVLDDDDMTTTPTEGTPDGGGDADGTDGGDADGTDGGDSDGTDGGDADGTDGDATDTTDGDAS